MNSRDYNSYSSDNEDEVSYDADTETEDSSANYDTDLDGNEDSDSNSRAEFANINAGVDFRLSRSHERFLNSIIFNSSNVFSDEDNESVASTESALWREGEDYNDRQDELNEEIREALEENNAEKLSQALDKIDESRVNIDAEVVRTHVILHDDAELFDVIQYSCIAPSSGEYQEWLYEAMAQKCENILEHLGAYFKICDSGLFDFVDLEDAEQIEFYLKYVFREYDTNPRFKKEIAKCVKLLSGSYIELEILEAMGKASEKHGEDSFQYAIRKQLLQLFEDSNHDKDDRDDLIQQAISKKSKFAEQVFSHYKVSDTELFEIVDLTEDEEIAFYLKYVLRKHKDHLKFNDEIAKCIDLLKKDDVELRIATALCYESLRHPEGSFDCRIRRDLLKVFDPELAKKPIAELADYLKSQETAKHDYLGANLSDDSDSDLSDSEIAMGENLSLGQLTNKADLTSIVKHLKSIINGEEVAVTEKNLSSKFPPSDFSYTASEKAKADLAILNRQYEVARNQGKVAELLNSLETKFSLLYFRGLSYYTTHWSQPARRHHRNLDEVGHPQFASASLRAADIAIDDLRNHTLESIEEKATPHAKKIINFKRKLEDEENFYDPEFRDRKFSNALYFFHELYTDKYDLFPKFLKAINSSIDGNPLASTGETPRHPFNYALGVKIYEGHENKRLRPRHNNEGRCERPHSGKVYFVNLPLAELASTAMVSVPILNYKAEIVIDNLKIAEREAAFWGMIKGEWIIGQSAARYPSFDKKYNPKYLRKYGLTKEAYNLFSQAFESFAPHTNENKLCKLLLGTYLSAFYEQKAMRYCVRHISNKTQPVFLGMDGKFSFKLGPYTPFVKGATNQITRQLASDRRANKRIDLKNVKPRVLDFSK